VSPAFEEDQELEEQEVFSLQTQYDGVTSPLK
jgi:hypothetical protein